MFNKSRGQYLLTIKTYKYFFCDPCVNQKAKIYSRDTDNEKKNKEFGFILKFVFVLRSH